MRATPTDRYGAHVKVAESRSPYFTRIFRKVHFADHVDAIGQLSSFALMLALGGLDLAVGGESPRRSVMREREIEREGRGERERQKVSE